IFAHAITTDAWRNSLDHYQEFVIIVALDLKIEVIHFYAPFLVIKIKNPTFKPSKLSPVVRGMRRD
ncbi:hypothetical protein, partial [Lacticaseibacillus paracasei]|uniref:hypothetical protein n=1 Tax=Lacticaseibacillus paracasei TaxID=1597 RepID=UPI001957BCA8